MYKDQVITFLQIHRLREEQSYGQCRFNNNLEVKIKLVGEEGFIISEIPNGNVAKGSFTAIEFKDEHFGLYRKFEKGEYATWKFIENISIDSHFLKEQGKVAHHTVNIIDDLTRGDVTLEQVESNVFYYSKLVS